MKSFADFRSDTFTMPDSGMRKIIYEAEVGNAGFGEDPSVNLLEETIADYFKCESAVFLPSATMAGQIAIAVWCRPGDMVIIEEFGHNYYFETGAMSAIAGAQAHLLSAERGLLRAEDIASVIVHAENPCARTALIILENTSNFGGGSIYPQSQLEQIFHLAQEHSLPVHIDGARIWNVLAAESSEPSGLLQEGGSMSVCFSKGLGAPMGAVLLGNKHFIDEARRVQLMLGGVMRQVGFMAAAGLYAFRTNRERLLEDHENAAFLAENLSSMQGLSLDPSSVETNIVYVDVEAGKDRAEELVSELASHSIGVFNIGNRIRLVTSMLVDKEDCQRAITAFAKLL